MLAAGTGATDGDRRRHTICMADLDDISTVLADPDADEWTTLDIAAYLGVALATVHTYRYRTQQGIPGWLPQEDHMRGRTPTWHPATIMRWRPPLDGMPGKGGGRSPGRPAAPRQIPLQLDLDR